MSDEGESQPQGPPPPRVRSLSEKLDLLFREIHPSGRGEFSYREVAEGIEKAGGPSTSHTYLWQLRTGKRTNPTMQHLEAIAGFFRVPLAYFVDDATADQVNRELSLLAALRDAKISSVALRLAELSPEGVDAITRMVDEISAAESAGETPPDRRSRGPEVPRQDRA
ncbi:hypothetical protein CLV35_0226 [Motilibacter peucedani]|uniref:HTH cro/C1-type domain-containing protein n=1 Tax=Motilibacter peucedani TaxID=598650 RepID=A0A420XV39_9ACTN|nr:helix-turn-helix transcriptional regulator [Motilibacter peucedani]RKS80637.1 hypothetical protein CLV35_0226 [Motilibacter peucedani]